MKYDWMPKFLAALSVNPNVTEACRQAKICRSYAYDVRKADPEFAAAWEDAHEQSTDALVGGMYTRAFAGTEKPVYQGGVLVGTIREFSDTLAIFLAKAHRPEVYGDTAKLAITGAGGGPVQFTDTTREQATRELAEWRTQMTAMLANTPSAPPTPPTSPAISG